MAKYIFDFDDVLFNNTKQFKEHMFKLITKAGVSEDKARAYYLEVREKEFSLRKFIAILFSHHGIAENKNLYENIIEESHNFLNTALVEKIRKIGKENCYIITNGEREFNQDKIKYSGIGDLFKKIYIVPGTKKDVVTKICAEHKNDEVIFIEDKIKFINDLDVKKCRNLKTILYAGQDINFSD